MKKILLLNTYMQGGAAIACYRLGKALIEAGHQVNLLTIAGQSDDQWVEGLDGIQKWKGKFYFYAERFSFWSKSASHEVRFSYSPGYLGLDFSKHPLVQQADILHLHWINHGLISHKTLGQLERLNKPIVWTMHDMWPFTGGCHYSGDCTNYTKECGSCNRYLAKPNPNDLTHQVWKEKKKYYKNLKGVTPSRWLRDCANASSLMKGTDVVCIPNCIDVTFFKPINSLEARNFHKLPLDKSLILFLAPKISDTRKGFAYLLEALTLLKKESELNHENIELIVVGKIGELPGIPYKTHSLGHISDAHSIVMAYNAADIFVIPSLEDNLPNTIMESLACGTPCVGFDTGGISEMIVHQKNGYVANYKDSNDLAIGMDWVLKDQTKLNVLRQNARNKALDDYTFEVVSKQYNTLYDSLLP